MKRKEVLPILLIAVFFTALTLTVGCITKDPVADGETGDGIGTIGIIVTILPQADFVEIVGGDNVRVTVMVPPGASPHTYEPTPAQLRDISKADIYYTVGSGVGFEEVWMDRIIAMNPKMTIIDGSEGIAKIGTDPHIWNSPVNAKKMVENLNTGLIRADPANAKEYTANKDRYILELDALDKYAHEMLDGFTNREFLIYHPSFGYFAREYNMTQIAIEHKGKAPTPQTIKTCVDKAREYNLSYIYVAPQFATEHAKSIAHEIGGQVVFVDPLPTEYVSNMRSVVASLALEMEQ